jgi:lipopolysaccharide export system protein LptA
MKKFAFLLLLLINLSAQTNSDFVTVVGDSLVGKLIQNENVREVIGNVVITQGNVKATCDMAIQYLKRNQIELLKNVVITQDTITLLTDRGFYFSDTKIAVSDTSIILNDGHIILKADSGLYNTNLERADFKGNVKLIDSANTLQSKKLIYFNDEDKAIAVGNVSIADSSSIIYADSLINWRNEQKTFAFNDIVITSNEKDVKLTGQYLEDYKQENYTKITGLPTLIQIDTSGSKLDTLLITSKIMEAISFPTEVFIATDSVKVWRSDFASVNKRSIYYRDEEKISIFKDDESKQKPILWFDNSQMVGDTVLVFLKENAIQKIDVIQNAFVLSQNEYSSFRYDQVSGDTIYLHFNDSSLVRTEIYGKMLSIYYMYEEGEPSGLIQSSAEDAILYFEDNEIVNVKMYGSPVSEFHPEKLIKGKELDFTLPSFIIYKNKPQKEELIKTLVQRKNIE